MKSGKIREILQKSRTKPGMWVRKNRMILVGKLDANRWSHLEKSLFWLVIILWTYIQKCTIFIHITVVLLYSENETEKFDPEVEVLNGISMSWALPARHLWWIKLVTIHVMKTANTANIYAAFLMHHNSLYFKDRVTERIFYLCVQLSKCLQQQGWDHAVVRSHLARYVGL